MNIEDLPEPIKTWAKVNRDESELDHIDDIFHAFLWNKTKESLEFWRDVYDSKSLEYLKKEYPHLPWIDKNNCSVVLENDHEKRHWISLDVKGSYDAYKHLLKNSESVRVYISDGVYDGWDFKDKNNSDDPSYSLSEYDPSYKPKTSNSIITTGAEDSVWVVRDQSDWHNPDYSATGFKGDTFTYLPSIKTHEITETEKFEWIESKPSPSTLEYMRDVEKARQILSESLLINSNQLNSNKNGNTSCKVQRSNIKVTRSDQRGRSIVSGTRRKTPVSRGHLSNSKISSNR